MRTAPDLYTINCLPPSKPGKHLCDEDISIITKYAHIRSLDFIISTWRLVIETENEYKEAKQLYKQHREFQILRVLLTRANEEQAKIIVNRMHVIFGYPPPHTNHPSSVYGLQIESDGKRARYAGLFLEVSGVGRRTVMVVSI